MKNKNFKILSDEWQKLSTQCKCGKKVMIPKNDNKTICPWCGYYVFRTKKDEFEYRIKERLK